MSTIKYNNCSSLHGGAPQSSLPGVAWSNSEFFTGADLGVTRVTSHAPMARQFISAYPKH